MIRNLASENITNGEDGNKWTAIIEYVLVTFFITLIPYLIQIGRPPTLQELYTPFLSSILAGIYAYIRIRDIDIDSE